MRASAWLSVFLWWTGTVGGAGAGEIEPATVALEAEFTRALADFDQAQQIQGENPDRARQLFRSAAQRFESLVAAGIVNGRLEYNLGNGYLQAGDTGKAILHYRRAKRLIPRDPLLADNLSEARSRCLTRISPDRRAEVLRSVFFWHYDTAVSARAKTAVVLYVIFFVLVMARLRVRRRSVIVAAVACACLSAALAGSVAVTHWTDRHAAAGVVTARDVIVHKGPGRSYQRQFEQPLQPGTEFTVREARRDWWNVEFADGNSGWIEASAAELVAGPADGALIGLS